MVDEHLGHRLKRALDGCEHTTVAKLASACGVTDKAVYKWMKTGQISRENLGIVARLLGVSVDWLTYGDEDDSPSARVVEGPSIVSPYKEVSIVGTAQLGPNGHWYEFESGDGVVSVPSSDPDAYAVRVRGQSMAPAIRSGWVVVMEPNRSLSPGEYVLVRTTDGESMVKELLFERQDEVHLHSVADGFDRVVLDREQIVQIDPVSFIIPPSKIVV